MTNLFVNWLLRQRPPRLVPLSDFNRIKHEVRQCDVLLVEGRSRMGDMIQTITQSPWIHAALYIGRLHDTNSKMCRKKLACHARFPPEMQLVIESKFGEGTVVSSLDGYCGDHLRICRPEGLSADDCKSVIEHATSYLGVAYDTRQILDLARFFLPWKILPRRWRSSLFQLRAGQETKTVCSTMIANSFDSARFPILPMTQRAQNGDLQLHHRNPKFCMPSDFDYSPHFKIIKYPFIDTGVPIYRRLPWIERMVNDNEEMQKNSNV